VIIIEGIEHSEANSSASGLQIAAKILFDGEPIVGLRVVATSEQHHDRLIELTTDTQGFICFQADSPGLWMISTLHIQRAAKIDHADWESFWSSITFEVDPSGA